jgi:hypothetical protein
VPGGTGGPIVDKDLEVFRAERSAQQPFERASVAVVLMEPAEGGRRVRSVQRMVLNQVNQDGRRRRLRFHFAARFQRSGEHTSWPAAIDARRSRADAERRNRHGGVGWGWSRPRPIHLAGMEGVT